MIFLAQPLLLIFAGIVLAAMLDGGARLLGRVLPIGRGWRLAIVTLSGVGFVVWTIYFAGTELAGEAERLRATVTTQINRILAWANEMGVVEGGVDVDQLSGQLMGTLGRLGIAVSSALGAVTSMVMILVIGIFIAVEPRLYQRGVAWMLPLESRDRFYRTASRMGFTLRRLMAGPPARHGGRRRRHLAPADDRRGADGGSARHPDRPARLPAQYRRDHLGRADRSRRLLGQRRGGALGDRRSMSSSRSSTAI